jgi:hypothetical protein
MTGHRVLDLQRLQVRKGGGDANKAIKILGTTFSEEHASGE